MVSCESLNLLLPFKLVLYDDASLWTRLSSKMISFLSQVTVKDHIIKIWHISSELQILLKQNLVWRHIIISWIVLWKDWIALLWSRSRSQKRRRIQVTVQLDNISSTSEPSVTQLAWWGIIMGQRHARRLVCCLHFRVTVRAHLIKYDYHIDWMVELFATTFNCMVHHHKLECCV